MSFYVSDSLKGRITEEDLLEEKEVVKSNFPERIYLEARFDESDRVCMPVVSIDQSDKKTVIEFVPPDDPLLFKRSLEIKQASSLSIMLTNDDPDASDVSIFSFDDKDVSIKTIRQSLLGYNYLVTIVIHDCIVF